MLMPPVKVGADPDNIGLLEIRVQAYNRHTNTYEWHNWWSAESWTPFDSAMSDPGPPSTQHVAHFKIPNKNSNWTWKIKGTLLEPSGTWDAKVKVGDTVNNFLEYNVPAIDENGEWELTLPALGPNNACWVWYSQYTHNPANIYGMNIHNCMRVRTM